MGALSADSRLTQAALAGGFVDSSHFSRMFRQTFGMTPSSVLKPFARCHADLAIRHSAEFFGRFRYAHRPHGIHPIAGRRTV